MRGLNDNLPLRRTTAWGSFRNAEVIPHRYGAVAGRLLPYSADRRVWAWADHAVLSIDQVTIEGAPVDNWEWSNRVDVTGRAIATVEFTDSIGEFQQPIARGQGKPHPRTGALIENPALVIWDVLANIAGRDLAESAVDRFRVECDALRIVVAGSIGEILTAQRAIAPLCESIGAEFCEGMDGLARIYPGGSLEPFASVQVVKQRGIAPSSTSTADDLVNALIVEFDVVDGQPKATIELEAPDSVLEYGRREDTLRAAWISKPRVAYDVAARKLAFRARPSWVVTATGVEAISRYRIVTPGQTAAVNHPIVPVAGDAMLLTTEADPSTDLATVTMRLPVGPAPRIQLVRQGEAQSPLQFPSITLEQVGTDYVGTFTDDEGRPYVSARARLDDQWDRFTDNAGRAIFPASLMTPGAHVIDVYVDGVLVLSAPVQA